MDFSLLKRLVFSNRAAPTRILRGPFRGAVIVINRRDSLRKIFGLYEHELNSWLDNALSRVHRVLDVGANDGYFTFGCAAALRRKGRFGEILAFEPQAQYMDLLQKSVAVQPFETLQISLSQSSAGCEITSEMTTLDAVRWKLGDPMDRRNTLVKIDVEGAEMDVLRGANSWLNPSNLFLIEVHKAALLKNITDLFYAHGLNLEQIDQRSLPLLGPETRDKTNWWLVSAFGET
jgi:Methyltransferase FkbM domain